MNLLHSNWFWLFVILSPIVTVVGILLRLGRSGPADAPPADIVAKTKIHPYDDSDDDTPPVDQPEKKS